MISDYVVTQPIVAVSSGEAEFYAMVRAILNLLFLFNFLRFFGHVVEMEVLSDSSAARGMIRHSSPLTLQTKIRASENTNS